MNIATKSFALVILIAGISLSAFAQQTATATSNVSAIIVAPLTLTKSIDLNFGNISVSGTAGTVVLSPSGGRSVTGGCQLPAGRPGTVTAAAFSINGASNYTYSITLPSAATTITGSGTPMSVDTYISVPSGGGTLTGSAATIYVGGTLHVASNQSIGLYTLAGGLTISVNFN